MKKYQSTDLCADRIDVITNFAVIMNVVIKRVHCIFVAQVKHPFKCLFSNNVQNKNLDLPLNCK